MIQAVIERTKSPEPEDLVLSCFISVEVIFLGNSVSSFLFFCFVIMGGKRAVHYYHVAQVEIRRQLSRVGSFLSLLLGS